MRDEQIFYLDMRRSQEECRQDTGTGIPVSASLFWCLVFCRVHARGTARFRRYELVSVGGIWQWRRHSKPATKERAGINPFTKEPIVFKARPAWKIIRARPVKAAKDAV